MLTFTMSAILTILYSNVLASDYFTCSMKVPESVRAEKVESCTDSNHWDYEIEKEKGAFSEASQQKIVKNVLESQNMGAAIFTFPGGRKKTVYRGSFMTGNPTCIQNLVKTKGVESIVNLYSGDIGAHIQLANDERLIFEKAGGHSYFQVLNYDYKLARTPENTVINKVVEIIKTIESAPGNVFVHCFGGIHRTGIAFAVMQKCLNKLPIEQVISEYRCHALYENEARQGGRKEENELVIQHFPCNLLK